MVDFLSLEGSMGKVEGLGMAGRQYCMFLGSWKM